MGEWVPIQFGAQTYQARSGTTTSERMVNLYLEANPQTAKTPVTLHGTPGLKLWKSIGDGPIRGMHVMNDLLYAVSGNTMYQIDKVKIPVDLGTIRNNGPVRMTNNGTHIAACTSKEIHVVNASTNVILTALENANGATYQDGYGIFSEQGTQNFYITAVDDMTSLSALDFTTTDALTGDIVGIISDHRELWAFCEDHTEIWYNAGVASFPFVRVQNGVIERGCKSGDSVAKAENAVFWLGDDLSVYSAVGYQPQKISTPAIDRKISETVSPETSVGWTYAQEGHTFYCLAFTDATFVFDMATGLWHERIGDGLSRWRPTHYAKLQEKHLVGDYANGNIYELDLDTYTDNSATLRREVTAPPLHFDGKRGFLHELHVDFETGVGLTSGQGSDPVCMLDWSDDGGVTWSSELTATIGKIGERKWRATFSRLGSFYQRTLRLAVSDPVKVAINGANARVEVGQ